MTETRTTSSTGGEKGVKPERHDLIPLDPLDWIARVYGFGATKYADHNWRRGYEWSKSYAALQRHLHAFWGGEDLDPESSLPHLAHAAFHALALLEWSQGLEKERYAEHDDRYKPETVASFGPGAENSYVRWDPVLVVDSVHPLGDDWEVVGHVPESGFERCFLDEEVVEHAPLFDFPDARRFLQEVSAQLGKVKFTFLAGQSERVEWGVGDTVTLSLRGGEGFTLERLYRGGWQISAFPGRPTSWTDSRISDIVLNRERGDDSIYTLVEFTRQRRPWREGTKDRWVAGDKITFKDPFTGALLSWRRAFDSWVLDGVKGSNSWVLDGVKGNNSLPHFIDDKSINVTIRRVGGFHSLELEDHTHDPEKIKGLGG